MIPPKVVPFFPAGDILGDLSVEDEVKKVTAVGRVVAEAGVVGLVVMSSEHMGTDLDRLTLVTFSETGSRLDSCDLGQLLGSDGGWVRDEVRLRSDGVFEVMHSAGVAWTDIPGVTGFEDRSRVECRVAVGGKTPCTSSWLSVDGRFEDPKTHELLFISKDGTSAVYRAGPQKPNQLLRIGPDAQRLGVENVFFPKADKPNALRWTSDRAAITCTNPDKTQQVFKR